MRTLQQHTNTFLMSTWRSLLSWKEGRCLDRDGEIWEKIYVMTVQIVMHYLFFPLYLAATSGISLLA